MAIQKITFWQWLRHLLFKEEDFESHVNTLSIKWDRIPNPTKEEQEVSRIPCIAHRTTARNVIGRLFLKMRWKCGIGSLASLTQNGSVLEVYPPLKHLCEKAGL